MTRLTMTAALALLCAACGGSDIGSYQEAGEAQANVMREMIVILEGVEDNASAEQAAGKIEALGGRLQEIAKRVGELPPPTESELQDIIDQQAEYRREFQQNATAQMLKIAQYPVLAEAWTNAMMKMQ
jgi:hypothetical protein